jgi:hypothetical protein
MRCVSGQGHTAAATRGHRASSNSFEVPSYFWNVQLVVSRLYRYMVATSDSPVPSWFIAGLSMAILRPFNEEKVKRTEEVTTHYSP